MTSAKGHSKVHSNNLSPTISCSVLHCIDSPPSNHIESNPISIRKKEIIISIMIEERKLISRFFRSPKQQGKLGTITLDNSLKKTEIRDESSDHSTHVLTPYKDGSTRLDETREVNESPIDLERREPRFQKLLCRSVSTEPDVDMNIGLRLALPDKVDIMRGLQAPNETGLGDSPYSKSKKLIIVPDYNIPSPLAPFLRINIGTSSQVQGPPDEDVDDITEKKEEIVIRTSEQEPSVHQVNIPSATDMLIHARICSLLEGYDQLLESRAKARKTWFDFTTLVGMDR